MVREFAGVGAGVGFGQAESPEGFARAELGQVFLLLLLAAEVIERADAERVPGGHGGRVGAVHAGDLLHGDDVGEVVHGLAAVGLRDEHAEESELGHLPQGVVGELLLLVELACDRLDLVFGETADRLPQNFVLGRKAEIHAPLLIFGFGRIRADGRELGTERRIWYGKRVRTGPRGVLIV